jgi:hypothetical protein
VPVIVIILLIIAVILSAIAAERSARGHHRLRAVCLNLFGIGCLGAGLVSLYAWSHGQETLTAQIAFARAQANPGTLVELFLDSGQQATEQAPPAAPAAPDAPAPEQGASADSPPPATTIELTAEAPDPPSTDPGAESLLPEQMMSQVQIDYAARPAWVGRDPRDEGPVHLISVVAGPYSSLQRAHQELDVVLKQATDEYINDLLQSSTAADWISYDAARIRRFLVGPGNVYDEKVLSPSVGLMHQSHALLTLGPEFQHDVQQTWHQIVARARLVKVAMAAAAILGTLALLLSYFRADTATRGFYTGRLKFATFVAILGLIACGFLLARSIPWLWP